MNGHWLSTTRKLNKHYQSGSRAIPAPLWGSCGVFNLGCSLDSSCGLVLDDQGVWACSVNADKLIRIPQGINPTLSGFTTILPIRIYDLTGISLTGIDFNNLVGFTSNNQILKCKKDTVNFDVNLGYGLKTYSKQCLIVYVDTPDVPVNSRGNTRLTTFMDVKWSNKWIVPKTSNLTFKVQTSSIYAHDPNGVLSGGNLSGERVFYLDSNDVLRYYPPTPGSFVDFDTALTAQAGDILSVYHPTIGDARFFIGRIENDSLDWVGSYNTAYFSNGEVVGVSLSGIETAPVPSGKSIRVYNNEFDTTLMKFNLGNNGHYKINGTGSAITKTEVTGWRI